MKKKLNSSFRKIAEGICITTIVCTCGMLTGCSDDGYKEPINMVAEGWSENDSDKIIESMFSAEMIEESDDPDFLDDIDYATDSWVEYFADKYGNDFEMYFELNKPIELSEKKLEKYQEFYDSELGIDIELKKGYKVKAKMVVEGDKDSDSYDGYEFMVLNVQGEGWRIYPAEGCLYKLYF